MVDFSFHFFFLVLLKNDLTRQTLEFVFLLSNKSLQKCFGEAKNKTHPACDCLIVPLNRHEYFSAECLAAIIKKRPRLLNAFHPNKEARFVSAQQKIGFQRVRLVVGEIQLFISTLSAAGHHSVSSAEPLGRRRRRSSKAIKPS